MCRKLSKVKIKSNLLSTKMHHSPLQTFCTSFKPDFHLRFSLVDSEIFRIGHAQSGETNRTGRKNIFRSVRIGSSNIPTSAKFSHSETNQTSFLSHVDSSRGSKNFHKMAAHSFVRTKRRQTSGYSQNKN